MRERSILSILGTICKWVFLIAAAIVVIPIWFCIELSKRY